MSTAGNTNCVDRARERKRWGGGSQPLHQREAESLQGGRVSALISASSHLTGRGKTVTLAKLLNCRKEDEREQDQGAHEPEGLQLKHLDVENWRRYSIEALRQAAGSPLRWLRPSGGSAGLQVSELRRQTQMFRSCAGSRSPGEPFRT